MLTTYSKYLTSQRLISSTSNRLLRHDLFTESVGSARFVCKLPRPISLKNDHAIPITSAVNRYSLFTSLRRSSFGFYSMDLFTQKTITPWLTNGNSRTLRTASWRIAAALDLNSSPHRNQQTRLFADTDRSGGKNKMDAESSTPGADGQSKSTPEHMLDIEDDSKLTLAQRFKKMWKQYWYVLLPVHAVTSLAWFGLFYGFSASGVDVLAILEFLHIPEKILNHIRNAPQAGHVVVAFALYKIITPLRYMSTLGVTYYAIKHLSRLGYIKPMPNRKQIKAYMDEKRDQFRRHRHKKRNGHHHHHPSSSNGHHHQQKKSQD